MHSVPKKVAIKRKIDPSTNAKEIKVKKVDTNMKVKKSATKAELISASNTEKLFQLLLLVSPCQKIHLFFQATQCQNVTSPILGRVFSKRGKISFSDHMGDSLFVF